LVTGDISMEHPEAFRTFASACERLIFLIQTSPLTMGESRVVEYYCKEILNKIAPTLPNRPPQTPP
jgi:hypothetical protein